VLTQTGHVLVSSDTFNGHFKIYVYNVTVVISENYDLRPIKYITIFVSYRPDK
jgi:hypothetical protein